MAAGKGDGGNMAEGREGGQKIKIMFMEMIRLQTTRRRQLKNSQITQRITADSVITAVINNLINSF